MTNPGARTDRRDEAAISGETGFRASSRSDPMTTPPTICLCMIVRDEEHVVLDALRSIAPVVDRWVIVDTGSVDDTVGVIERFFAEDGTPGELHRRPWVDFGTNRTEAIRLAAAHGDFTWMLDADDMLVGSFDPSTLDPDVGCYHLPLGDEFRFWRAQLFRSSLPWRYVGVVHEHPVCDLPFRSERLDGDFHVIARSAGARSRDPDRFTRDAALLEAAVDANPDDARSVFYLAQSQRDAGRPDEALRWYDRRIELGGWDEEVWYSRYQRARCLEESGRPWAEVETALLDAWEARPGRAEPLHDLARTHRLAGRMHLAYLFARAGSEIPLSADSLFVSTDVYRWRLLDERSIAAYYCGHLEESRDLCRQLLDSVDLPADQRDRVSENLRFARTALAERSGDAGT